MKGDERRKDARVEKHFMAYYKRAGKLDKSWRMSPLKDISGSGARFLCEEKYAVGDQLELKLYMPASPKPQRMSATIIRMRETENGWNEVGVRFGSMDAPIQQAIDSIVKRFLKKKREG